MNKLELVKEEGLLVVSEVETFSKYYLFEKVSDLIAFFLYAKLIEGDKYRIGVDKAFIPDGFDTRTKRLTVGQMQPQFICFLINEETKEAFEFDSKSAITEFLENLAKENQYEVYY